MEAIVRLNNEERKNLYPHYHAETLRKCVIHRARTSYSRVRIDASQKKSSLTRCVSTPTLGSIPRQVKNTVNAKGSTSKTVQTVKSSESTRLRKKQMHSQSYAVLSSRTMEMFSDSESDKVHRIDRSYAAAEQLMDAITLQVKRKALRPLPQTQAQALTLHRIDSTLTHSKPVDESFFLTECAIAPMTQWDSIAKPLAFGSFALYALHNPMLAREIWTILLSKLNDTHIALRALVHHHLGMAYKEDMLLLNEAMFMQEACLRLATRVNDTRLIARAHKSIGAIYFARGDMTRALQQQQHALRLAQSIDDEELEGRIYANLGNIAMHELKWTQAIKFHERDLALGSASHLNSAVAQTRAHTNLAVAFYKLENIPKAQYHERIAADQQQNAYAKDIANHSMTSTANIHAQITSPTDPNLTFLVSHALQNMIQFRMIKDPHEITLQDMELWGCMCPCPK